VPEIAGVGAGEKVPVSISDVAREVF